MSHGRRQAMMVMLLRISVFLTVAVAIQDLPLHRCTHTIDRTIVRCCSFLQPGTLTSSDDRCVQLRIQRLGTRTKLVVENSPYLKAINILDGDPDQQCKSINAPGIHVFIHGTDCLTDTSDSETTHYNHKVCYLNKLYFYTSQITIMLTSRVLEYREYDSQYLN